MFILQERIFEKKQETSVESYLNITRIFGHILREVLDTKPGTLIKKRETQASGDFKGHFSVLDTRESMACHQQVINMVVSKTFKGHVTCMMNGCLLELPFPLKKHTVTI